MDAKIEGQAEGKRASSAIHSFSSRYFGQARDYVTVFEPSLNCHDRDPRLLVLTGVVERSAIL